MVLGLHGIIRKAVRMRLTDKQKNDRRQVRIKELGLVKLQQPITIGQRLQFKSVLRGESKIVKNEGEK